MYKSHHQHIFASVSCCRSCHCIAQVVCAFSGIINLTMQWWPSLTVSSSLKRRWRRVTQASVFLIGKNVQKINLYIKISCHYRSPGCWKICNCSWCKWKLILISQERIVVGNIDNLKMINYHSINQVMDSAKHAFTLLLRPFNLPIFGVEWDVQCYIYVPISMT